MPKCVIDIDHDPALKLLSKKEIDMLNENSAEVRFKKNETVVKQDSLVNNILFGKSGIFKLHMEGAKHDIILTLKKENTYLGLSYLYSTVNTHQYSITALEDSLVYFYDKDNFEKVLAQNVKFANEIIKYTNHNFSRILRRFLCVAQKNARGKIAEMILCFSASLYDSTCYTMNLSRSELADFSGLSMENTVRILKEFDDDGIIKLEGKSIDILNKEKLEMISDFG